jgi:hypothetical protein
MLLTMLFILGMNFHVSAIYLQKAVQVSTVSYNQYSGVVLDSETKDPLVFASLAVSGTNINTITNGDGEFLLKIPKTLSNSKVVISFLGYKKVVFNTSDLTEDDNEIFLEAAVTALSEVDVVIPKKAVDFVKESIAKKGENYINDGSIMTGFYRETIKKRRQNVSLSEAVVTIYKQPYTSGKKDAIKLYKSRKSTNYTKLDTVALKLQGGPFAALYLDIMKYPEFIFTDDVLDDYIFTFGKSSSVNGDLIYAVNFKQNPAIDYPLYYGTLYINAQTKALNSAVYHLNIENRKLASEAFVRKKPKNVNVYPTQASYRVDYREVNGRWYYGYSNVQLTFKVNWKNRLFNSVYALSSEMAITDWVTNSLDESVRVRDRLRPTMILADEASGFTDPEFWGEYNVIEPEKSIESAIKKIQKQLKKAKS